MAGQAVSHGLRKLDGKANLLFNQQDGELELRCALTDSYSRIWDADIVKRCMELPAQGWRVPPARPAPGSGPNTRKATAADVLRSGGGGGLAVKVGDEIAPAGLYASDRDLFMFMVNESVSLENPACPSVPLNRGFFLSNSEVGDRAFTLKTFLYDAVCGNHIVWGASEVNEVRIVHLGNGADEKAWSKMRSAMREYAIAGASADMDRLRSTQSYSLGRTRDDVLSTTNEYVSRRNLALTQAQIVEAYDIAEKTPRYGAPTTPWGIVQGLTEISQRQKHASGREKMDRAAGKILEIAF